ncbi:Arm DNA-binding domain-containing protein [uncultured Roseobacter sp.]|uniref:Arm DNA-binding domain-containing protein n=1 Tax=uncultured Roseobacter sp. TaxID=114847 RepID=UPI00344B27A7
MATLCGKLTKKLVENLEPGRHGDGAGLYLVVDPSGARRWIVRVTVKDQKNRKGAPLLTDFGFGGKRRYRHAQSTERTRA